MFENPYDVLNWIGKRSGRNFHYAHARSGGIFVQKNHPITQAYIEMSTLLCDHPDVICNMLHHFDWRTKVVGSVLAIMQRKSSNDSKFAKSHVHLLRNSAIHDIHAVAWSVLTSKGLDFHDLEIFLEYQANNFDEIDSIPLRNSVRSTFGVLHLLGSDVARAIVDHKDLDISDVNAMRRLRMMVLEFPEVCTMHNNRAAFEAALNSVADIDPEDHDHP